MAKSHDSVTTLKYLTYVQVQQQQQQPLSPLHLLATESLPHSPLHLIHPPLLEKDSGLVESPKAYFSMLYPGFGYTRENVGPESLPLSLEEFCLTVLYRKRSR